MEAIKEPSQTDPKENYPARAKVLGRGAQIGHGAHPSGAQQDASGGYPMNGSGRNRRDVWTIPTSPFKGAHFATFPPKLVEPCVLAGCPVGGIVLDPFCGSGTVGAVAQQHGRRFVGLDMQAKYLELARERIRKAPIGMGL
jgi:hypothetical protein